MTTNELLTMLTEAGDEVISAALKCHRGGSLGDLSRELGFLLGVMDALPLDNEAIARARYEMHTKIDRAAA